MQYQQKNKNIIKKAYQNKNNSNRLQSRKIKLKTLKHHYNKREVKKYNHH